MAVTNENAFTKKITVSVHEMLTNVQLRKFYHLMHSLRNLKLDIQNYSLKWCGL
jgi:hypothetical protein